MKARWLNVLTLVAVLAMLVSACTAPAGEAPAGEAPAAEATAAPEAEAPAAELGEDAFTTPHPILGDLRVRQAIAHCIDRDSLISANSGYLTAEERQDLRMDSFLPKAHWAYSGPYTDYPYDPEAGAALLEEAGWTLPSGGTIRENANGEQLALSLTTTDAQFRQTWAAVAEQNLEGCGFDINRNHIPASYWFGDTTGLARREFELGAYAWVGQADPSSLIQVYYCNLIPTPRNNWEGQNYMGWCNQEASEAAVLGNNSLEQEDRIAAYDVLQEHFARDMVSLPLFQRAEAEAWSTNLQGVVTSETEYSTASAANWTLADGGDTLVIGFTQEPASMFTLVESAAVQAQAAQLGIGIGNTQYDYEFQPVLQTELSTLDSGLATNQLVAVGPGDMVWTANATQEELGPGTRVLKDQAVLEYDGESELELPQLTVTYRLNPYTWSDGTPGSIADVELAYEINCDPESGATTFVTCESIQSTEFSDSELEWTITYLPGMQDPLYYLMPWSISPNAPVYPSHQVLSDGRLLADVPANEWATLPEIAETPLSYGPFYISEWIKGQSMTFEANPYYEPGTGVERIIIVMIGDTNQAVAQLLGGDVDYLDKSTLGGGAEVGTLIAPAEQGLVNLEIIRNPTWEHIDMNLFVE